jgi:hypothetical protein
VGAIFVDGEGGLGLLGTQGSEEAVPHGFRQAEDAGEGRTEFVTHGGQKLVLGAGGAAQLGVGAIQFGGSLPDPLRQVGTLLGQGVVGEAQRYLGLPPLRDVREVDHGPYQLSVP